MSSLTDKSKRIPAKEIRKEHRTRDKAGNVAVIPKNSYAIITQKDYQNSLGLFRQGNAFLQPIRKECELECSDGRLYIRGLPASLATLKSFYADKIPNLDLPFLRFFLYHYHTNFGLSVIFFK